MKSNKPYYLTAIAGVGLFTATALLTAEEGKPKSLVPQFEQKIRKDSTPLASPNGQITTSYADVVENLLPSVVTIKTYAKEGGNRRSGQFQDELDSLPPQLREFFREYLERGGEGQGQPRERRQQRPRGPQQTGLGSGIIITDDGYALTNNHVVDGSDELKISIEGHQKEYTAKVIGADPSTDVALIKIDGTGFKPATIGDSALLRIGDVVLAAGAPTGLSQSVSQGIVSGLGRSNMGIVGNSNTPGYEDFIQTDAAINPGNSGGPLVDAKGRVIGINTAIQSRSGMFAGIGFAIPINMALNIASDLLDDGKVDRGFLGIQMSPLDSSLADFLGIKDNTGVTVSSVVEDSPAHKAGFESGDVVVAADGVSVKEPSRLRLIVSAHHAGQTVKFKVIRYNEATKQPETLELNAVLEKLDNDKLTAGFRPAQGGSAARPAAQQFLPGVSVSPVDDNQRQTFRLGPEVSGLVVTKIDEKSNAAKVGLQEGDVIAKVNRREVSSLAEALSHKGEDKKPVFLEIWRDGFPRHIVVNP